MDDEANEDWYTQADRRMRALVTRAEVDRSIEATDQWLRSLREQIARIGQAIARLEQTIQQRRGGAHAADEDGRPV